MTNILKRVAVVLALVTAAVFSWIRRIDKGTVNSGVATAPVVIAQSDMPEGSAIERMSVVVAQWPLGTIPPGAFTSIDSVAGRVTRVSIFKGEVLVPGRLAPNGSSAGLEVRITPGKRAMSFRFNDESGVSGLIQPNSRVDMLVITEAGGERGRVAKLFMENVRVLGVGAVPQRAEDGRAITASVATVEVTPDEGERLAVATTHGQIQLMLRGYGDPASRGPNATHARIERAFNAAMVPRRLVFSTKPDTTMVKSIRGRELERRKSKP